MIIAEIGLNHLGNPNLADKYLDSLLNTEVDAITFQIRENDFYDNPPSPEMKNYKLSRDYYTPFTPTTTMRFLFLKLIP